MGRNCTGTPARVTAETFAESSMVFAKTRHRLEDPRQLPADFLKSGRIASNWLSVAFRRPVATGGVPKLTERFEPTPVRQKLDARASFNCQSRPSTSRDHGLVISSLDLWSQYVHSRHSSSRSGALSHLFPLLTKTIVRRLNGPDPTR